MAAQRSADRGSSEPGAGAEQSAGNRIVDVKDFITPTNETEFNDAIGRQQAELDSLHAAIEANATLTQAIASHKPMGAMTDTTMQAQALTAKDVVAAEVLDDGEVVLYVHKKN